MKLVQTQIHMLLLFLYQLLTFVEFSHSQLQEKRISDLDILLPLCHSENCNKAIYQLSAYGGCYEWYK